ncbi:LysE family translocator [Photobacterium lipolyticum]|uniref:Threonine transporter RhtB n=1 Tax=Photobacterium lipolyticum TaxID=266810 RepID=A0A2T3N3H0_9GAMM|nr:LysE family translocator [Photobacterium lipolyticum]PSW06919.1 threonine transporter RhtB [Photobacterium lipolyticum]
MDPSILIIFIPTFFAVSATPGLCMTLAMTLGMTIGVRRSLWMMAGELVGVALVSISALIGVATILLAHPNIFLALKYLGGAYLLYLGIQMWRSRGKMAIPTDLEDQVNVTPIALATQGFVTAIANPKAWAFMISLLPPFIDANLPLRPQATILISVILCFELICMLLYATGGRTLRGLLQQRGNVMLMNRIAGSLMIGVSVWLVLG